MTDCANRRSGVIFILLAGLFWSFGGVLSKFTAWNAFTLAGYRSIVSVVILGLYRRSFKVKANAPTWIGAAGVIAAALLSFSGWLRTRGRDGGETVRQQVLLETIRDSGRDVGFKASGGIREFEEARKYLILSEVILGTDWPDPAHFRIGASSLLDDLIRVIENKD